MKPYAPFAVSLALCSVFAVTGKGLCKQPDNQVLTAAPSLTQTQKLTAQETYDRYYAQMDIQALIASPIVKLTDRENEGDKLVADMEHANGSFSALFLSSDGTVELSQSDGQSYVLEMKLVNKDRSPEDVLSRGIYSRLEVTRLDGTADLGKVVYEQSAKGYKTTYLPSAQGANVKGHEVRGTFAREALQDLSLKVLKLSSKVAVTLLIEKLAKLPPIESERPGLSAPAPQLYRKNM